MVAGLASNLAPTVAFVKGFNRKENIVRALQLLDAQIDQKVTDCVENRACPQLFIKVNAMDSNFQWACTHPKAVEAVIEFFGERVSRIVIGDNSFVFENGGVNLRKLGYPYLLQKYPKVTFSGLTSNETIPVLFRDIHGDTIRAGISSIPLESDLIVSLAIPKTHDTVIATGAVKNMMGCVVENRRMIHGCGQLEVILHRRLVQSCKVIHGNLVEVLRAVKPHISVLDGFVVMEGDGPLFGSPIQMGCALASCDSVAVDAVAFNMLKVNIDLVRYLHLAEQEGLGVASLERIQTLGDKIKPVGTAIRMHRNHPYQTVEDERSVSRLSISISFAWQVVFRYYRLTDKLKRKLLKSLGKVLATAQRR